MKALRPTIIATAAIASSAAWAQAPGPPYVATRLDLYTATAALWRTDAGFQSTIRLKNVLAVSPLDVTVTLYMADGTPYALPAVHLGNTAVATVSVNAALATAPASLNGHLSQTGSATFQYRYDWAGAALGSISILDTVRSLQYLSTFNFPEPSPTASPSAGAGSVQMMEGMWWKYSAASSVFLSAANTTNKPATANIAVYDNLHQPLGKLQVSLAPHASQLVVLDSLIGTAPTAMLGGIELSYTGDPQTLLFSGGIEDDLAGYSATLRLGGAMSMNAPQATSTPPPAACTMASAGLMVGKPDPMEGFPSTVSFSMFGFARNTDSTPLNVHSLANYIDNSGPHNIPLPDQTLQPGEARNLNLANAVQLPFQNGSVNLSFTFSAPCGSLLLETGSVDTTGSYVFEVLSQAVGKSQGRISQFWQVGAGTDTMYSLWNPSSTPEDLVASVYYGSGGVYRYPVHLGPNASAMISIMELIQKAVPDANGNSIPGSAKSGSLTITNSSPDVRNLVTFVMASGIYNPVAGTCCSEPVDCTGATSTAFSPSTFSVANDGSVSFSFYIVYDDGSTNNYTSAATYSPSSNISVTAGEIAGLSAGSATLSAGVPDDVPEYVPCYCAGGTCPTGSYGGSTTGTVYDPTPVISSVTPSTFVVGSATSFTISGQYFGTNCPTLQFPFAASYSLSSCADTAVSGTATASAAGSGDLVFTSGGYGGQGFQASPGQTQTAQSGELTASNPTPTITSVTLNPNVVGSQPATMTITGTVLSGATPNLPSGLSIVTTNNSSATQMTISLFIALSASYGTNCCTVSVTSTAGKISKPATFSIDGPGYMVVESDETTGCAGCAATTVKRTVGYQIMNLSGSQFTSTVPVCENPVNSNWTCQQSSPNMGYNQCNVNPLTAAEGVWYDTWTLGAGTWTPKAGGNGGCGWATSQGITDTWQYSPTGATVQSAIGYLYGYILSNAISINGNTTEMQAGTKITPQ